MAIRTAATLAMTLALALTVTAAAEHDALAADKTIVLLQTGAARHQYPPRRNKSSLIKHRTKSIVEALKAKTQQLRKKASAELRQRKSSYAHKLAVQQAELSAIQSGNERLAKDLQHRKHNNDELRLDAEKRLRECNELEALSHDMLANLTAFQHYVIDALRSAEAQQNNSTVLGVLAEQDAADELRRQEKEKMRMMLAVRKSSPIGVSLLQVDPERTKKLIDAFSASYQEASHAEAASLAEAERSFNKSWAAGEEQKAALMNEQAKLKAELESQKTLKGKLTEAAHQLEHTRGQLLQRNAGLRRFLRKIAKSTPRKTEEGNHSAAKSKKVRSKKVRSKKVRSKTRATKAKAIADGAKAQGAGK